MSSRRQLKIGNLLQETLGEILNQNGAMYYGGKALVSITQVNVTPDLLLARINLSVYNVTEKEEIIKLLKQNKADIKRHLGKKLRHNFRRMPELEFHLDTSIEDADRMERILKDIDKGADSEKDA